MESSFLCWLWWLINAVVCCVGAAVVVRQLLVPWSYWLGRRALCWCKYALFHGHDDIGPGQQRPPPSCRCCGGVNFDGMTGSWAGKRWSMCLLKPDNMTVVVAVKRHFLAEFKIYKDIIVWVGRFFSINVIPRLRPLFIILKRKMKEIGILYTI